MIKALFSDIKQRHFSTSCAANIRPRGLTETMYTRQQYQNSRRFSGTAINSPGFPPRTHRHTHTDAHFYIIEPKLQSTDTYPRLFGIVGSVDRPQLREPSDTTSEFYERYLENNWRQSPPGNAPIKLLWMAARTRSTCFIQGYRCTGK